MLYRKDIIFLIVLLAGLTVMGCSSSDPAKNLPKGIIGGDKMKAIYIDIFLAEASVQDEHVIPDSSKKLMQRRYIQISAKYGVKTPDLINSLKYYTTHPQVYSEVLQTTIDSLSSMEARTH
jgi:hypothetical protein